MYLLSQVDLKLKWQDTSGFEKHQIFDKKANHYIFWLALIISELM
jgi:hypothetical protein